MEGGGERWGGGGGGRKRGGGKGEEEEGGWRWRGEGGEGKEMQASCLLSWGISRIILLVKSTVQMHSELVVTTP